MAKGLFKKIRNTATLIKNRVQTAIHKRDGYPPNPRQLLEQHGDATITGMSITRAPIASAIPGILNALSLGTFAKRFSRLPYDKLFHLKIDFSLDDGTKISVEKNEVITMTKNYNNSDKTEYRVVSNIPEGITLGKLLDNAENHMGKYKYFQYNPSNNNCQDFIMAILNSNDIQGHKDFVKQETDSLFKGQHFLSKVALGATNLGASADVLINGKGLLCENTLLCQSRKRIIKKR